MGRGILQPCSRKRKDRDDVEEEHADVGIPMALSNMHMKSRVIFVLEKASLTLALVGKLNCCKSLVLRLKANVVQVFLQVPKRWLNHETTSKRRQSSICDWHNGSWQNR
ncbi:uncharacterized protein LOC120081190 isoform X2 [Benincasa hispida]|uniref:uncharacterized protein LOC120081190 isoform X2 n=1 Tax=Benincasa hispida TaxID=102211 RepID=UPI0019027124|nr:uncharacterized protein LOC120081190 isoform X2 [Benincasa hispida]